MEEKEFLNYQLSSSTIQIVGKYVLLKGQFQILDSTIDVHTNTDDFETQVSSQGEQSVLQKASISFNVKGRPCPAEQITEAIIRKKKSRCVIKQAKQKCSICNLEKLMLTSGGTCLQSEQSGRQGKQISEFKPGCSTEHIQ